MRQFALEVSAPHSGRAQGILPEGFVGNRASLPCLAQVAEWRLLHLKRVSISLPFPSLPPSHLLSSLSLITPRLYFCLLMGSSDPVIAEGPAEIRGCFKTS